MNDALGSFDLLVLLIIGREDKGYKPLRIILSLVLRFKSSSSLSNYDSLCILIDFSLDFRVSNGGSGVANMLSRI